MKVTIINGKATSAQEFAFDGCHKIFLIRNEDEHRLFREQYHYDEEDFFPISMLEEKWDAACDLRFIYTGDIDSDDVTIIVGQDENDLELTIQTLDVD